MPAPSPSIDALFHAIVHLDTTEVAALLSRGASAKARNSAGKTTLEAALAPLDADDLSLHNAGEAFTRQHAIEKMLIQAGASVIGEPPYEPPLLAKVLDEGFFAIQIEESDACAEMERLKSWVTDGDARSCPDIWGPAMVDAWIEGMTNRDGADEEDEGIQFGHQVIDFLIEHAVPLECFAGVGEDVPGYEAMHEKILALERQAKVGQLEDGARDTRRRTRVRA